MNLKSLPFTILFSVVALHCVTAGADTRLLEKTPSSAPQNGASKQSVGETQGGVCAPGSIVGNPPLAGPPTHDYGPDGMVRFHFRYLTTENQFLDNYYARSYDESCVQVNGYNTSTSPPGFPLPVRNLLIKAVPVNATDYVWRSFDEDTGASSDVDWVYGNWPPLSWPVVSLFLGHCDYNPACTMNGAETPVVPVRRQSDALAVTAISPDRPRASGSDQFITVFGRGFAPGLAALVTDPSGGQTAISGADILATRPGAFVARVNFSQGAGRYSIRVIVPGVGQTSAYGFSVACPLAIQVHDAPERASVGEPVGFAAHSDGCGGPSYEWDFGDGSPQATTASPTHVYAGEGVFTWKVVARDASGASSASSGSVAVSRPSSAPVSGLIALKDPKTGRRFRLNGGGVSTVVQARSVTDNHVVSSSDVINGFYEIPHLPAGDIYYLAATIQYEDGSLSKEVTLGSTELVSGGSGPTRVDIDLGPPLAMIHGWNSSPTLKWTVDGGWDEVARESGVLSFTPQYGSCPLGFCGHLNLMEDRWESAASEVFNSISANLEGLSTDIGPATYPTWNLVGHSQGGLIARTLVRGRLRATPLVSSLDRIDLLGTPNSGGNIYGVFGGDLYYLLEKAIKTGFNRTYTSFGNKRVFAYAGTKYPGPGDGFVRLESVRNILEEVDDGGPFRRSRDRTHLHIGGGYDLEASHSALGGTETLDILRHAILGGGPVVRAQGAVDEGAVAPVGIDLRVTAVRRETVGPDETLPIQIAVGPTDLLLIDIQSGAGTPSAVLIDPAGRVIEFDGLAPGAGSHSADELGLHLMLRNPEPGAWSLRLTAGAEPLTAVIVARENSPVAVETAFTSSAVAAGAAATVVARVVGAAESAAIEAEVVDSSGATVATIPLADDGAHGDGASGDGVFGAATPTLAIPGRYAVVVRGELVIQGEQARRQEIAFVDVRPADDLFTGEFEDEAVDSDGDSSADTIRFTAAVNVPAAGTYTISGELYDSQGVLVDSATGSVTAAASGEVAASLDFSTSEASCVQFGDPFRARGLTLRDAATFAVLEEWTSDVETAVYAGASVECASTAPSPKITGVQPAVLRVGESREVSISGSGFAPGSAVSFGPEVAVTQLEDDGSSLLRATVAVAATAALGPRQVTVTSPGGISVSAPGLVRITEEEDPSVAFSYPSAGASLSGTVIVSATAADDSGIARVEFSRDGQLVFSDPTFPYQAVVDTSSLPDGPHTLTARAVDVTGRSASADLPVAVANCRITTPGDLTLPADTAAGSCGAVVVYSAEVGAACGEAICTPASGSIFPVGTTEVICTTPGGSTASFAVTVTDITAPVIGCPAPVVAVAASPSGVAVTYELPPVSDNCAAEAVACVPAPGSVFPIGVTPVTCGARDAAGNAASCSFDVTVRRPADTVGVYSAADGYWFLRNYHEPGAADIAFAFGPPASGWVPLRGDWDGDGADSPGLYAPQSGTFFLTNANDFGSADVVVGYGPAGAGWVPIVGDWDGDGDDTVGLYAPASGFFFLRNENTAGPADVVFGYGPAAAGWAPLVGDWDGDGTDTVGLYAGQGGNFFLRNENAAGPADVVFGYGPAAAGWTPVAGDWDGDGIATVGLYAPTTGTYFLREANAPGPADRVFGYGPPNSTPVCGNWDGN